MKNNVYFTANPLKENLCRFSQTIQQVCIGPGATSPHDHPLEVPNILDSDFTQHFNYWHTGGEIVKQKVGRACQVDPMKAC